MRKIPLGDGVELEIETDERISANEIVVRTWDGRVARRIVNVVAQDPPEPPVAMMVSTRPEDWAPRAREIIFGPELLRRRS